jgi:hypothetical protein
MAKRRKTEGSVGSHKTGSVHVRVYVPVKLTYPPECAEGAFSEIWA